MGFLAWWLVLSLLAAGCGESSPRARRHDSSAPAPSRERLLTIVGTSDLHGRVERVAALAGHVAILRRLRAQDGGAVLLVDAGDMWHGTLESNLHDGAPVVRAYGVVGYDAAAIGNHELEFSREAIVARAREARFALLAANVIDRSTGRPLRWPPIRPSVLVEKEGIRIGIVGVTTDETASTLLPDRFTGLGLAVAPLAQAVEREARALRARGATVVVVLAHAGGRCEDHDDPADLESCQRDREVMRLARDLPPGLVDAIVGGHTHQAIAHVVHGTPVIESWARGRAFGRVDLRIERASGRVLGARVHPPQSLCEDKDTPIADCDPSDYEGQPVRVDAEVLEAIAPELARAREVGSRRLGPVAEDDIDMEFDGESALGNLLVDLLRESRPAADVALLDGSEIRTSFDEGPLTYRALYEVHPFDRRMAIVRTTGAALRRLTTASIAEPRVVVALSGVRVEAGCAGEEVQTRLRRENGAAIGDDERITVVTTDFIAAGGDDHFPPGSTTAPPAIERELVRDALERRLAARRTLRSEAFFDSDRPRMRLPAPRPLRCPLQR